MKKILALLVSIFLLSGCATFGTFANLERGESTKAEVHSMLGEPHGKHYEKNKEVWEYRFVRQDGKQPGAGSTVMNVEITFEENVVANYQVTVSTETGKELPWREGPPPPPGRRPPVRPPR